MRWRFGLALAAGVLLCLGSAGTAQAHPRDNKCFDKIHKEQRKLERDIAKHGFFSRQAQHRRVKIERMREACGYGRWGFFGDRDDRWRGSDRNQRWDRYDDRWQREQRRGRGRWR